MGAGKSAVGVRLARKLGWSFVDLDEWIVQKERKAISEIFAAHGESAFREMERATLADVLGRQHVVAALGGGALETAANREILAAEAETLVVYLEAPLEVLMARCASEAPGAPRRPVFERQAELASRFERRRPFYESAHWTVATAGLDPDAVAEDLLARWRDHWGRP